MPTTVGGFGRRGVGTTARVQVLGVPEAIRKLGLVGSVAGRETGLIVLRSAFQVRDQARENVHSSQNPYGGSDSDYRYSNDLLNGIQVEAGGRAGGLGTYVQMVSASSRAGGSDREYAAFEEQGTSKAPAHPYLRPAINAQVPKTVVMLHVLAARLQRL